MDLKDIFKLTKLERLKALQLYAKQLVDTIQVGGHQSAKRGSGIEFKEYKNYTVGDSLKQLDWKYYARTDHYMIKEAEVERLREYLFVLDKSFSMDFQSNSTSKMNYAKAMIASLAYIADRQHDAYMVFKNDSKFKSYTEFVYQLLEEESVENFSLAAISPTDKRRNKSTTFMLTDAYYSIEALDVFLKKWKYASDEVVFIHLLFENEVNLSFEKRQYRFQDLETGQMIEVNTKEQLAQYQTRLYEWHEEVKAICAQYQVLYYQYDGREELSGFMLNLVNTINQSI